MGSKKQAALEHKTMPEATVRDRDPWGQVQMRGVVGGVTPPGRITGAHGRPPLMPPPLWAHSSPVQQGLCPTLSLLEMSSASLFSLSTSLQRCPLPIHKAEQIGSKRFSVFSGLSHCFYISHCFPNWRSMYFFKVYLMHRLGKLEGLLENI